MLETFLTEVLKLAPRQMWGVEQLAAIFKDLFSSFSMQKLGAYFMAILEFLGLVILDTPVTPRGEELDLTGYSLVFEDHFEWYLRFGGNDPLKCHVKGKEDANPEVIFGTSSSSLTELEKHRLQLKTAGTKQKLFLYNPF